MTTNGPASQLSVHDRKDLEKYTKHLIYKIIQVIVQSRFGEKSRCHGKPDKSEWFNLAIDDVKEVNAEASKAFDGSIPCINGQDVNVEVSVRTVDGDRMVLEVWTLDLNDQSCDSNVHVTHAVYNRMALLLKSLISMTRITPAYRYSREQGPECFVICYRIYIGEAQIMCLGDEYEDIKVGQVGTPLGALSLKVMYRTRLTITPHEIKKVGSPMLVNSDYFIPEESCELNLNKPDKVINGCNNNTDNIKLAANKTIHSSCSSSATVNNSNGVMDHSSESCVDQDELFHKSKRIGAFASSATFARKSDDELNYIPEAPFMSLLSRQLKNWSQHEQNCDSIYRKNWCNNNQSDKVNNGHCEDGKQRQQLNAQHNTSPTDKVIKKPLKNGLVNYDDKNQCVEDDFVLVELKTPFAGTHMKNELADFFHDCRTAPALQAFADEQPTIEEQFDELNDQFAGFEMNMQEYDNFVNTLCSDEGVD